MTGDLAYIDCGMFALCDGRACDCTAVSCTAGPVGEIADGLVDLRSNGMPDLM